MLIPCNCSKFLLAGYTQVYKEERLSCTIWTPIVKNIGKTYSIKVQGDFYLHCWRRVIRHFRVFRTEKSLGVILRIFSSIQIFIFYFILLKVFLRSSCQQCNVVTHLLVLHFGWHQRWLLVNSNWIILTIIDVIYGVLVSPLLNWLMVTPLMLTSTQWEHCSKFQGWLNVFLISQLMSVTSF